MSLRKEVNVLRSCTYGPIPKPVSTRVENAPHPFLSRKFKKKVKRSPKISQAREFVASA